MKSDFSMASILTKPEKVVGCDGLRRRGPVGKLAKDVQLRLRLEDADLWRSFHCMTNEMIVTKNGRLVSGTKKIFSQNCVILFYD